MKRITIYLALLGVIAFALSAAPRSSHSQQDTAQQQPPLTPKTKFVKKRGKVVPNHYIVVLKDDVAPDNLPLEARRARIKAIARRHAKAHRGKVYYIYETALKGYSITLPNEAAAIAISKLPVVRWVEEDSIGEWLGASNASGKPSVKTAPRPSTSPPRH